MKCAPITIGSRFAFKLAMNSCLQACGEWVRNERSIKTVSTFDGHTAQTGKVLSMSAQCHSGGHLGVIYMLKFATTGLITLLARRRHALALRLR